MFNILYKGRVIYKNLDHDECTEILDQMIYEHYNEDHSKIDLLELELEEI